MKKILILFLVLFQIFFSSQDIFAIEKNISVSAVVGSIDVPSRIKVVSPDYLDEYGAIEYVESGKSFALDFLISDPENAKIYFTVTTNKGVVSVENGGPYSTLNGYRNQFIFLAGSVTGAGEIVITSNDGVSVTTKKIQVYIY